MLGSSQTGSSKCYNLIHIREVEEWKTAFINTSVHNEDLFIPYGVVNEPSVFQASWREFLNQCVIDSLKNIQIYKFYQWSFKFLEYILDERELKWTNLRWKQWLRFMEFANFNGFSSVAAPLTIPLKRETKDTHGDWQSHTCLMVQFVSAPILHHPDSALRLMPWNRVGAILSQRHPFAFFGKLTKLNVTITRGIENY